MRKKTHYIAICLSLLFLTFTKEAFAQSGALVTSGVVYNSDSSANSSRSRSTSIRVPENLINPTQGWVAIRVKMGFANNTTLTPDPIMWDASESDPAALFMYYDIDTDTFRFSRNNSSTSSRVFTSPLTFAVGDVVTLVSAWDSSTIKISINGQPFIRASANTIPQQGPFYIASSSSGQQGTGRQPNSDYYWVAAGTGTLTDADAATINNFGNADRPRSNFPGNATFMWNATSNQYNETTVTVTPTTATVTPTPTVTITSQPLQGDGNGDGKVDGIDFAIWAVNYGQQAGGVSNGDYNNDRKVDGQDYVIWVSNYGKTGSTSTVSPTQTNTPSPTRTASITLGQTVTVSPTPTTDPALSSPYGVYPNCIAPGIGLEGHSWWHEKGEPQPRHVHHATCLPNARTTSGSPVVSGIIPAVFRIMAFNHPGYIGYVRWGFHPNSPTYHDFRPDLRCQTNPNELKECTWYVKVNIDTSKTSYSGLNELRMHPDVEPDGVGGRQYNSNNFQLHRGGSSNFRSSPAPISRGWYTGLDYVNVSWSNYMEFFRGRTDITMPIVSGTISLKVDHSSCTGSSALSEGYVDADFHAHQRQINPTPIPKASSCSPSSPTCFAEIYKVNSCWTGTATLDTTKLSNGVHSIYLQTNETNSSGTNSGAQKYFVRVQN